MTQKQKVLHISLKESYHRDVFEEGLNFRRLHKPGSQHSFLGELKQDHNAFLLTKLVPEVDQGLKQLLVKSLENIRGVDDVGSLCNV